MFHTEETVFHDPTFNIAQKCSLHIHSLFITVNIFNVRKSEKKIKNPVYQVTTPCIWSGLVGWGTYYII